MSNEQSEMMGAGSDSEVYTAAQLQPLLSALQAAKMGDASVRLPVQGPGVLAEITTAIHEIIQRDAQKSKAITAAEAAITALVKGDFSRKPDLSGDEDTSALTRSIETLNDTLYDFTKHVTRLARDLGTEGRLGGQLSVPNAAGAWQDVTDELNSMANNLTAQVRNTAQVITAVAHGDFSRKVTVDVKGEILEFKDTVNAMVDLLNVFATQFTQLTREVGTEGLLGGQVEVPRADGTWKELTNNFNVMLGNLTNQSRNMGQVLRAAANGDTTQKMTVDVRGEILEMKNVVNGLMDNLSAVAAASNGGGGENTDSNLRNEVLELRETVSTLSAKVARLESAS